MLVSREQEKYAEFDCLSSRSLIQVLRSDLHAVVWNPFQSSPSFTIFVSLFFLIIPLVFFYLSKLLFSGFFPLQLKGETGNSRSTFPYIRRDIKMFKFPYILLWQPESLHDWMWKTSEFSWRLPVSSLKRLHRLPIQCSAFPLFR